MLGKILSTVSLISLVLLVVLLVTTTPSEVGPFGVLAFFVLSYLIFLGLATGLLRMLSLFLSKLTKSFVMAHPITPVPIKRCYYLGTVLAMAPVLILAMQSFGGIGFLELGLVAALEALGCFLVVKR
ncbi:MAG: hypothetical protein LBL84_03775 [Candidatus Nomurabacteria bacterium]|jgi:hypothetical protein|nr:hypothetical protein [Candidatus Nomurabacteria bacterium]